tara:strand:+ start:865 stop:1686 length:822 start_codon:yes stop_codon:yes gene_type:complete
MLIKKITVIFFVIYLVSCSNTKKDQNNNDSLVTKLDNEYDIEKKYTQAMIYLDENNLIEASKIFNNIEKLYPLSNEAIQSQIMSGFIDYVNLNYDSAIFKFNSIIRKYPSLKNLDYVYYMKALCFYEQIKHEDLDGEYNKLALKNLNQVIIRFPNSEYAKDSYQKIILVKSNIAAKHISIARFYHKKSKLTAALNRYQIIVSEYSETKFTPEALYRIAEIYYSLGMIEEAKKTASVLGYNYPDSEWYKYIYNDLTKKNEDNSFSKSLNKLLKK